MVFFQETTVFSDLVFGIPTTPFSRNPFRVADAIRYFYGPKATCMLPLERAAEISKINQLYRPSTSSALNPFGPPHGFEVAQIRNVERSSDSWMEDTQVLANGSFAAPGTEIVIPRPQWDRLEVALDALYETNLKFQPDERFLRPPARATVESA